jgi:hypothetical protein
VPFASCCVWITGGSVIDRLRSDLDFRDACACTSSSAMTSQSRVPPLLAPYILSPPRDSLILLTNTLGTSANWIILRYLCGALGDAASSRHRVAQDEKRLGLLAQNKPVVNDGAATDDLPEDVVVMLVSWLRDDEFWRTEARRVGVSLHRLNLNYHG